MFAKSDKLKHVATIMVGFTILMFGMDTMSGAVKPLANIPEFASILTRFSNPLLGMLAGLVLTAIIQSSSASVGMLQALCLTGVVGYGTAIPIIMGQNIGTCVTALLSGIGASKNGKRAALVHLYFNIIGTVVFMIVFYTINAISPFAFLGEAATPFGIAIIHSLFNIAATICLLPFSRVLVKLACLTIKTEDKPEEADAGEKVLNLLDARFLDTPFYAVEQCRIVAVSMAELAEKSMNLSMELLDDYSKEKAEQVKSLESQVDHFEDILGSYLVKLSSRPLTERDNQVLTVLLHSISDFERISDHALNIMEAAKEMHKKDLHFSEKAQKELEIFSRAIHDIMKITVLSFMEEDLMLAAQVEPLEEVIDNLNKTIKQRHVKRLRKGKCTIEMGFVLTDIITNYERVSDHCSNIAVCLLTMREEDFDTHAYLNKLKREDNIDFRSKVMAYEERYQLPS